MKRILFLFVSLLMWGATLPAQQNTRYAVYFETGHHELGEEARQTLDQVLKELQYPEDYSVDIFAHTDSRGSEDYNLKLAERRSKSVNEYLAARGLKTEKTSTASLGESDPAHANNDESGRKLNRRVDLVVNIATLQSLSELTDRLSDNRMQYFTISPEKSVQLTGKQGTNLWIEARSFEFTDGSGAPDASVEIALRETYTMADMLLADLTTSSGDQLLETAGMFYVDATSNGKSLQLKSDAQIVVSMPAESLRKGMQLFLGEQNAEGKLTNWQATGQGFQTSLDATLNLSPMPRMPTPKRHRFPVFVPDYSTQPKLPEQPRAPYKPVAPRRETVIYKPGFMDRMVMGKEKVREKEEAMYQKQVAAHEKHVKHYEEKQYPAYLAVVAKYEADKASFPARSKAWIEELAQKKANFYESGEYLAIVEKYEAEWEVQENIWQKKLEAWNGENKEKIEAFEAKGGKIRSDMASMDAYFYQVNRLGWVNCDIFSNDPGERMQLAIRDEDDSDERIYIILKDRSSILSAGKSRTDSNVYVSAGIPKTTPLKILAIKLEAGRPMMAVRETRAGEESEYKLEYKSCSLKDIRKALQGLNG
ncbi:MAG: OmpA family protein [Saprospiraceae bacterium]|nr:OmpA family protein [Saprospiraceae bacterium]